MILVDFSATKAFPEIDYNLKMVIRRAIIATLDYESLDVDAEVSVTLCDNTHIRKLNKKYRSKDKHTDVLSFPMYDLEAGDDFDDSCGAPIMLGDIVISLERCKEQAAELGNTFLKELAFLTVHSMLHLLGYDHEKGKEAEESQCLAQRHIIDSLVAEGIFEEEDA